MVVVGEVVHTPVVFAPVVEEGDNRVEEEQEEEEENETFLESHIHWSAGRCKVWRRGGEVDTENIFHLSLTALRFLL